jgi:hypothetical protein
MEIFTNLNNNLDLFVLNEIFSLKQVYLVVKLQYK